MARPPKSICELFCTLAKEVLCPYQFILDFYVVLFWKIWFFKKKSPAPLVFLMQVMRLKIWRHATSSQDIFVLPYGLRLILIPKTIFKN